MKEAGKHFMAGDQAYKLGDFTTAVKEFEEAFRLSEDPIVLFNIAQATRKQYEGEPEVRHLQRARDLYRTFLREVPDSSLRSEAEKLLKEVEDMLAARQDQEKEREKAAAAAAAAVVAPTRESVAPAESIHLPASAPVSPGALAVANASREGEVQRTQPWYKKSWVWATGGTVVVGAVVGIVLATRGSGGGVEDPCGPDCRTIAIPE